VNFFVMLGGIYYPISVLPGWVQAISAAIPLTYFLDGIRAGYGFPPQFAFPVTTGFALALLYTVLAHWALAAAVTRSRRTGLLLKLSE
jgi:ABC-2 type transport system permease protein